MPKNGFAEISVLARNILECLGHDQFSLLRTGLEGTLPLIYAYFQPVHVVSLF
jgi:hypothetical protein